MHEVDTTDHDLLRNIIYMMLSDYISRAKSFDDQTAVKRLICFVFGDLMSAFYSEYTSSDFDTLVLSLTMELEKMDSSEAIMSYANIWSDIRKAEFGKYASVFGVLIYSVENNVSEMEISFEMSSLALHGEIYGLMRSTSSHLILEEELFQSEFRDMLVELCGMNSADNDCSWSNMYGYLRSVRRVSNSRYTDFLSHVLMECELGEDIRGKLHRYSLNHDLCTIADIR